MKLIKKEYRWIILAIITIIIRIILGFFPQVIETIYSRGVFLGIRWLIDNTTARLPFPMLYLLVFAFAITVFLAFRQWFALWQIKALTFSKVFLSIGNFLSVVIISFLILWGFNYGREPLEKQLNLNTQTLNLEQIIKETEAATIEINNARKHIPNTDTFALSNEYLPKHLVDTMRRLLVKVLNDYNYPTTGKVQGRLIVPKGFLMRLGASGIYLPWIGEGNIDASLHATQLPFTIAHELAHGYGFGDEGSCNFWAYLACLESDNPMLQYSGKLTYWRYIASEYKYFQPEAYAIFRAENLNRGVHNDLEAIYANREKYPTIIPFQNQAYDTYLKFQGVEDGIESYSRMVLLVKAWKAR
jgi:hypothetical protein